MAKINPTTIPRIQLYRSTVAGRKPALADLADGELALNSADGAMFSRAGNTIYNIGIPSNADYESLNNMTFANITSTGQLQIGRNIATENRIWFGGTDVANSGVVRCSAAQQMVISAPPKTDSNAQVIFLRPRGDTTATNQTTITGTGILTSRALASETTLTVAGASTFTGTVALNNTVTINATGAFTNAATSTFSGTVNLNGNVVVNSTGTFSVASQAEFTSGFTARAGLELYGTTPYIDFHHANSTADYTSRLITSAASELTCIGGFKVSGTHTAAAIVTTGNLHLRNDASGAPQLLFQNTAGSVTNSRIYSETAPAGESGGSRIVFATSNSSRVESYAYLRPDGKFWMPNSVIMAPNNGSNGAIEIKNFGSGDFLSALETFMGSAGVPATQLVHHRTEGIRLVIPTGNLYASDVLITSDIRHKRNLVDLGHGKLSSITGYSYDLKNESTKAGWVHCAGLVAQELLPVLPEAVDTTDPEKYTVRYNVVIAQLVNEFNQEVKLRKALEKRIADLEGKI